MSIGNTIGLAIKSCYTAAASAFSYSFLKLNRMDHVAIYARCRAASESGSESHRGFIEEHVEFFEPGVRHAAVGMPAAPAGVGPARGLPQVWLLGVAVSCHMAGGDWRRGRGRTPLCGC